MEMSIKDAQPYHFVPLSVPQALHQQQLEEDITSLQANYTTVLLWGRQR